MANIANNITETIGRTPLVRLSKLGAGLGGEVLVKLEGFNPNASVKDRIGRAMIEAAERDGKLKPGVTIIEATSGNTGIGLAFAAAVKGYRLILVMPDTMSVERRVVLRAFGAELVLTPGPKGIKEAIALAEEIKAKTPGGFIPQQFLNPANPKIHRETTGPEIWNDTDGTVDILVSGVGTGGTLTGVSEFIKPKKPSFKVVAVEPVESQVLQGGTHSPHKIQGIGTGFIPDVLRRDMIDEVVAVSAEDSIKTARRAAKEEGILIGISGGAAVEAALRVAAKPENKGKQIVTIVPDYGERYISTILFEDYRNEALNAKPVEVGMSAGVLS
jgi:cysteine synthase A